MIVLGATGQVGSALCRLIPDAIPVRRTDLDLATATLDEVNDLLAAHPSPVLINAAGYTAVDDAEDDEETALRVNGEAVGVLAEATAERNMVFVTYSTDYVFDGRADRPCVESDPTDPINAYGRTKLAGERAALAANPRSLVIRTSWVVSGTHRNFVATVLDRVAAGEMRVVDDQTGCPTMADDLAQATLLAVRHGVAGILHRTNQGPTTWYQLARAAAEEAGLDPDRVIPITTAEYPTAAARPAYSVLESTVGPEFGLPDLPEWRASLPGVVSALRAP